MADEQRSSVNEQQMQTPRFAGLMNYKWLALGTAVGIAAVAGVYGLRRSSTANA